MDELFFQISDEEKDDIKEIKRIDIAIFLHLLLKSAQANNRIKNIQKRFKAETGGLLPSEIDYLFTLSETERIFSEGIKEQREQYKTILADYRIPTYGKAKLSRPISKFLYNFAQDNFTTVNTTPFILKCKEIIIRKDLYPRIIGSDIVLSRIQELSEANTSELEKSPIIVNQKNELVDGYIRLMALKRIQKDTDDFEVFVNQIQTKNDRHLKELMFSYNSRHGTPLDKDMKRLYAQELVKIENKTSEEISKIIGVSRQTIDGWTKQQRVYKKLQLTNKVLDLTKRGYTETQISNVVNVSQPTISNIIKKAKIGIMNKQIIPMKPMTTTYWNIIEEQNKSTKYFGKTPEAVLQNLLYFHTKENDHIVDFFAGSGTMYDACKKMNRYCHCYDRKPLSGRDDIIKKWNILKGFPPKMPTIIDLLFLDPPYWRQAEGEYSTAPEDFGNMSLDDFNKNFKLLFENIKSSSSKDIYIKKIAILICPTIYDPPKIINEDHAFDFHTMLCDKYKIIDRYHLIFPCSRLNYSTNIFAENKKCVTCMRDLVVYGKKS